MVKHIDIVQRLHHFGNNTIAIVVHVGKVLWTRLAVKSSWVHNLDMMVILIKTRRHIGLVVSVHDGIHHQLTQRFIRVIQYIFLAQNTYYHRAFGDNAVADKVLQFRQYLIQSTFESALVHYFSAVIVPFETYVLEIALSM